MIRTTLILALTLAFPAAATDDLGQRLDAHLKGLADNQGFSGIVLVARGGEIVLHQGYGLADREAGVPVTPETVFTVGSITKQFTGAAILKLEMMGKLDVTEAMSRYLDGVPEDKQGITIHHLLTHSAGFPAALGFDFDPVGREEYLALAFAAPLESAPGERYEYSNVGYSLLAAILEKVSGQSYEVFLGEHLFRPAGLRDTGYVLPKWAPKRLAHGYRDGTDWGSVVDHPFAADGPYWHLRGNGGIHSTAADMYRWHQALTGDKVLSAAAKEKLYGRHVPEGGGTFYGYGWSIDEAPGGGRLIAHNGGNPYFFADFLRYLDDDVVVFLAANGKYRGLGRLGSELARVVFDPSYAPAERRQVAMASPAAVDEDPLAAKWGLPGSDTGRRSAALLEILVTEGENDRRALIEKNFAAGLIERRSIESLLKSFGNLSQELKGFELRGAKKAGPHRAELDLAVPGQEGVRFTLSLELEPDAPHGINLVDVEAGD